MDAGDVVALGERVAAVAVVATVLAGVEGSSLSIYRLLCRENPEVSLRRFGHERVHT